MPSPPPHKWLNRTGPEALRNPFARPAGRFCAALYRTLADPRTGDRIVTQDAGGRRREADREIPVKKE